MHHIIYMSTAAAAFTEPQLQELLMQARVNNARLQVTGLLLVGCGGNIVQVMEGEEAVIGALYARIAADARHSGIVKLADKPIAERSFADWAMAYQPLTPAAHSELTDMLRPDQFDFTRCGLDAADALLLQLLRSFVLAPEPHV